MRISFRTTLEQSLVEMLKQMAKDKNKNMNDILEEILYFYYGDETQQTYFVPKMPLNYVGTKDEFLQDEIAYISAKILKNNDIDVTEDFFSVLQTLSKLAVQLAERDKRLNAQIEGKVEIGDIVKNADIIKKALESATKKE